MPRAARLFFMHLGTFVPVFVYFNLAERAGYSAPGVQHALGIALAVHLVYAAIARAVGELKQFDFGLITLWAGGLAAAWGGIEPVVAAFQHYSAALLFATLAATSLVPRLAGAEPFTAYYGRRQTPLWQQRLPLFETLLGLIATCWTFLFILAATAAAWSPRDWRFTFLIPNLLTLGVGTVASAVIPLVYVKLFPPPLPDRVEPLLLGMPFVFDRRAGRDARASIQFRVTGGDAGNYWLEIARGRCKSFAGEAPAADLTIHTPDAVWLGIAHGRIDGAQALAEGLYRVEGDLALLARLTEWFPTRARA